MKDTVVTAKIEDQEASAHKQFPFDNNNPMMENILYHDTIYYHKVLVPR